MSMYERMDACSYMVAAIANLCLLFSLALCFQKCHIVLMKDAVININYCTLIPQGYLPMTRSLAEASTRELVSATPYRVKRDEVVLRLP